MATQSAKATANFEYTMKSDISTTSESILKILFNALFAADLCGIKTDHSPSHHHIRCLDIYQVQQLMQENTGLAFCFREIITALGDLVSPRLMEKRNTIFKSELDGKKIDCVRLRYGDLPDESILWPDFKLEIPKINEDKKLEEWKKKAFQNHENYELAQMTIANLRAVVIELSEKLHELDGNARISITSSELLELMYSNTDSSDNPF